MEKVNIFNHKTSTRGFSPIDSRLISVDKGCLPILQWYIVTACTIFACLVISQWFYRFARTWYAIHYLPGPQDWFPPGYLIQEYVRKAAKTQRSDFSYEFSEGIRSLAKTYSSEGLFRAYLGLQPTVVVFRADFVEKILSDQQNIKKHSNYRFLHPWLGLSVLTSDGNEWRHRRKLLTPAFHFKTLDNYTPSINARCTDFINYLKEFPQKDDVRLFYEFQKLTLDIVGETTMGFKMDSLKKQSTYTDSLSTFQHLITARTLRPWVWPDWIYSFIEEGRLAQRCCDVLHRWSRTIIRARHDNLVSSINKGTKSIDKNSTDQSFSNPCEVVLQRSGTSFLDILLESHLRDPQLTLENIREEVDTVLFAGQDTTATTVAYTLYLLGLHKDAEARALKEIDETFGEDSLRPVTQDDLRKLKYIEASAKEAMRLFPPIPLIGRQLDTDVKIGNYVIPRGVELITLVYQLHRDPVYFPDPEQFCPDRFLGGRRPSNPFAYVPFSAGPRNCIGQKVAMMEVKIILAHFLRHFRVESTWPIDKLKICFEIVTRAKGGLRVKLVPRQSPH